MTTGVARGVVLALALAAGPLYGAGCTVVSAGPVGFGTYDVFSTAPLDSTGSVSYACTQASDAPVIRISAGASGDVGRRTLSSGGFTLAYNLYTDATRTQVWSDGAGATYVGPSPAPNQTYTATIFARVPAGQNVPAGTYSDTVTLTIDF